jgi:hypothetical protein
MVDRRSPTSITGCSIGSLDPRPPSNGRFPPEATSSPETGYLPGVGKLTQDMKRMVEEQRLGFVATVTRMALRTSPPRERWPCSMTII